MELKSVLTLFFGNHSSEFITKPVSNGLINHTYIIENSQNNKRYILQKVNTHIFQNPQAIAKNHLVITKILTGKGYNKQILTPVLTEKGNYFDENEHCWRLFDYIEGNKTYLKVPNLEVAYKATEALSEFYYLLNSEEDILLEDPLPGFINFQKRIDDYKKALHSASPELIEKAQDETDFINSLIDLPSKWITLEKEGKLPQRIIHADPKISNVLFDQEDNTLAVIDLDTLMHGTLLYDFGDMVRSYTNTTDEDDGATKDNFSKALYAEVKKGFLSHLQPLLTPVERELLDYAAKVVIYIQAVRFFSDYLNGNQYYTVNYPEHNLDRTRNQINLLKGLISYLDDK